jgi:hypothetical protein
MAEGKARTLEIVAETVAILAGRSPVTAMIWGGGRVGLVVESGLEQDAKNRIHPRKNFSMGKDDG